MKHTPRIILSLIFVIIFQNLVAQQKTCKSKENVIEDFSLITKCAIKEKKTATSRPKKVKRVVHRKVRIREITNSVITKTRKKNNSLQSIRTIDNSFENNEQLSGGSLLHPKEVLFTIVDRIPLFPECNFKSNEENITCFNNKMATHFSKNFDSERALDETQNKKAFVQFTIDVKGNVSNIIIKSKIKSKSLEKELKRVIKKLPHFTPGIHKTLPVNVTYSFPVNLIGD